MSEMTKDLPGSGEAGRYRLLVEAITDYAIFMLDVGGHVESWNTGAHRCMGYETAEVLGRHFSCFFTDVDKAQDLPARALRIAAEQGRFEHEGWRVRKSGERYWACVTIDPILVDGQLVGYAETARDLSARIATRERMRENEEQLRLLVQSVTDYAIYMLDPEGRVTNWNAGAERIKGYSPDEIIGQHFSRFYTEEDRARGEPAKGLAQAIREGRFSKEGWRVRKDGTHFFASVVIDPVYHPAGKLIGFAKITRDVTDRLEAQKKLEEAREALFQSQKMETIGQLTGGVAHDFNNLLTVILSSLQLLEKRLVDQPKMSALVENAIKATQRGASLIQRMLSFARRQQLNPAPVDLNELVRGMADLLQRSLGPSIVIHTSFPLKLPTVLADANQLELALLNLATNSRDAMKDGGNLAISAYEVDVREGDGNLVPGRYVCLALTDSGEGMDDETLARAMDPFFTTKGVGMGTGLGLSMVHGLAEQSGGRLTLHSRPGEGTTAELFLPQVEPASPTAGPIPDILQPAAMRRRGLRVLLVDDDHLVLISTAALLEDEGYAVVIAQNAEEAMAILERREPIDVVITDHVMPEITGARLAETIAARWPALPVILASGYTDQLRGAPAALPRLTKPCQQHELVEAIERAVSDALSQPAQGQPAD